MWPSRHVVQVQQLHALRSDVDACALRLPAVRLPRGHRHARLVVSSASRYVDGGYAAHHYVPQPPCVHGTAYELELQPQSSDEAPLRVGYIAICAHGVATPTRQFPTAVPHRRALHAAQVERLVVLPHWRGCGVKEALLAVCGLYTARGKAAATCNHHHHP